MYDIIVVGGGLAGLVSATLLSRAGLSVAVFEKRSYPYHKVCGEYISNEVKPFLLQNDLFPSAVKPASISKFRLTSTNGQEARMPLDMGGFGISRYALDDFLYQKAKSAGVLFFLNSAVEDIIDKKQSFEVICKQKSYTSKLVIGAYGKRAALDKRRDFMQHKSPYVGVKYHVKIDLPSDEIALHNFEGGYCGISQVENSIFNLCYLVHRDQLRRHKKIDLMEKEILHQNPFLRSIWHHANFLFEEPLVINEISFEKKEPVHHHVLMCGDTAGMITPLCGNGMAMAIRSAKILSSLILEHVHNDPSEREDLETAYARIWHQEFGTRLWTGRKIQRLFGASWTSNLAVQLVRFRPVGAAIIKMTHGPSF